MTDTPSDGEDIGSAADEPMPPAQPETSATSRIVVRCAGRTAVGQVREHNEDNLVIANLGSGQIRPRDQTCEDDVTPRGLIFAVCDGMGGAAAGEVASQMAVDILVEAMRRGGPPKNRDGLARRLVGAVEEAGRRIFEAAQKERSRRGMGTTSTVAVLVDKVLFLAEVGDSRGYLLRRGQLKQLTKDQSLVNQLIEAGHLTEDEAEAFEHSNIILQALGTSETVQVDLTFVELRRGDRLMMCSDGLSGLVGTDMLRSTLDEVKDPAECGAKLIEYAETAGGHDNISVVVVDFDGEGLIEPAESDSFGYVQYPLPLAEHESSAFADDETTGAGARDRRSSGAEHDAVESERPSGEHEQDRDESLLPRSPEDNDPRANLLWVAAGIAALLIAFVVWFELEPTASNDEGQEQGHTVTPSPTGAEPSKAAPGAAAEAAEAEEIDVNVHTDVEHATLLVNGEAKGELSPQQSRNLKLRPGAYRFEAQSSGNQAAVAVVTVRGDMPMDVFLELPKAENEGAAQAAPQNPEAVAPEPTAENAPAPQLAPRPVSKHKHASAAPKPEKTAEGPAASAAPVEHPQAPVSAEPTAALPKPKPETVAATPKPQPAAPKPKPEPAKPSSSLPSNAEASTKHGGPETPSASPTPKQAIPENPF